MWCGAEDGGGVFGLGWETEANGRPGSGDGLVGSGAGAGGAGAL